ncbi:MAG TPA: hypothetical protein VN442_23270 [Bryobacteraceae bacterium]|nr:hypothetical protein [Bryobacteraceae bacterium]
MPAIASWRELLREAEAECRAAFEEEPLRKLVGEPARAFELLSSVGWNSVSAAHLCALTQSADAAREEAFARAILISASLHAIPRLFDAPFPASVKIFWAEEFRFFVRPPERWLKHFRLHDVRFLEFCRIATLRRVPAGQFHLEMSALPRSSLMAGPWRQRLGLCRFVARSGGFGPLAETHVNDRRRNRLTLIESEGLLSYYRLAETLKLQPGVRGLLTSSWLYCRSTAEITPRLAWLRRFFEENGAFLADLGPAPPDSGFLIGSEERTRLYHDGAYRPRMTLVLWPRRAILAWAERCAELGGDFGPG